jgi:hypothetical protein
MLGSGFRTETVAAMKAYGRNASRFQGFAARWAAEVDNRQLQTGTGTAQSTAISTVASTAVIFSLVDRSMVSSERVSPPYKRPLVLTL